MKFARFSNSKNGIDSVVFGSDDLRNCQLGYNRTERTIAWSACASVTLVTIQQRKVDEKNNRDEGEIKKNREKQVIQVIQEVEREIKRGEHKREKE